MSQRFSDMWPVPTVGPPHEFDPARQCDTSCGCHGMLRAGDCPSLPGCDSCAHWEVVRVPGHVVAEDEGLLLVHLHPGETLHDAVRREAEVPRWMN